MIIGSVDVTFKFDWNSLFELSEVLETAWQSSLFYLSISRKYESLEEFTKGCMADEKFKWLYDTLIQINGLLGNSKFRGEDHYKRCIEKDFKDRQEGMFLWFPVEELGRIHDVLMIHGNEKLDKKTIDKIAHLINISKDTGLFNKYDVEIYERNQQCKKDA